MYEYELPLCRVPRLVSPQGASVRLLFYGATVISWKSPDPANAQPSERLFLSARAALNGSKPVRGGIPIVFPCFGAPAHPDHAKLNQHGFGRSETWTLGNILADDETGVSVTLTLEPTSKIIALYSKPFHLTYVVTLAKWQLTTKLIVKNTSSRQGENSEEFLEFQALFHNYIRAPAAQVVVTPLQDLSFYDKTESTEAARTAPKKETRIGVDVTKVTDSVYVEAPQRYHVTWPGGGIALRTKDLKDVVIWNPQSELGGKLRDMEDAGWERFICVEPGHVRGYVKLESGQTWIGQQVLSVIHEV